MLAGIAVAKLIAKFKESRAELKSLEADAKGFEASIDEIINGPLSDRKKAAAAALVDAGDEAELQRRLRAAKNAQSDEEFAARQAQERVQGYGKAKAAGWWTMGLSGLNYGESFERAKAERDEHMQGLKDATEEVKIYQAALAELQRRREAAAAAEKKAAEQAAEAKRKADEVAEKAAAKAAADAEKEKQNARKETMRQIEQAQRELLQQEKTIAAEEKRLRMQSLTDAQTAANGEAANAASALAAAQQAWAQRGMAGAEARKAERREANRAAREERALQRQLGRYERGARDRSAEAAHNLQNAREAAAAADAAAKAAAAALAQEQKEQQTAQLDALRGMKRAAEETRDKVAELKTALVG